MPHLALISTSFPDGEPGSEAAGSFVADFATEVSRHIKVTVIAASSKTSSTIDGNLVIERFAVPRLPLSLLNAARPSDWPLIVQSLRAGRAALSRLVDRDAPDHIFALWALPSGHWADRVGKRHGIPFSIWALGSDIWSLQRIPVVRWRLQSVLRNASRRYADGFHLADEVKSLCGLSCDFLASTRSLDTAESRPGAERPPFRLAFLGRWHKNKGVDLLLDTLRLLSDPDWQAIEEIRIFGGGPLDEAVRKTAASLVADGRPVVVGNYLDKREAARLISWADYLLLPSRIESIPVIFSDAVQLGTPIIAAPVGDLPKLHQKYNFGKLADSVTAEAFCAALQSALQTSSRSFDAGLARAQADFSIAATARQFIEQTFGTEH